VRGKRCEQDVNQFINPNLN